MTPEQVRVEILRAYDKAMMRHYDRVLFAALVGVIK